MPATCGSSSTTTTDPIFKPKTKPPPTTTTTTTTTIITQQQPISEHRNCNPHLPFIIQSTTRCKSSSLSSLFLSTFTHNNNNTTNKGSDDETERKRGSSSRGSGLGGLRGFGIGCTAPPQVEVPSAAAAVAIRSSADSEKQHQQQHQHQHQHQMMIQRKKKKKKRDNQGKKKDEQFYGVGGGGVQDVCCGPGIGIAGFGSAADDCVVSTRPLASSARGKIDIDKAPHHRERSSYSSRQRVNPDYYAPLDLDSAFDIPTFGSDVFGDRYYHHFRNRSAEELAEIMMFQNGLLGRRSSGLDRFHGWRLDVDHMSYEELLELGDRIGYVSTGLPEDEIRRCVTKTTFSSSDTSPRFDRKCSICQEENETEDELGKLACGHVYHILCIKQWLSLKNACPVCKLTVASR